MLPRRTLRGAPRRTRPASRRLRVILVMALVAPSIVTTVAVVKLRPLMSSATQVANDFFDEARGGHPVDERLCAPARPSSGSTIDRMRWLTEQPEERFRTPHAPDEITGSIGQYLSQVWVSGTIGEGVDTATVSGRLDLPGYGGGRATPVSVRLRHVDDRWCVRDVWLGISHREAIRRN
jgi:hypothetical protein